MLSLFATVPMIIAVFLYILPYKKLARALAAAAQAALTLCAFYVFFQANNGDIVARVGNYENVLGVTLRVDTLSSVFLILTAFIFLIVTLYCVSERRSRLFWFFLFIWEGLLNGIFLSRDLFNIFVLLEAATVVVSVLLMYNRGKRSMYDGMLYLMVNTVAMQFFLFGVGYIYKLTGVLDMDAISQAAASLDKAALILPFSLIMTAVCLKGKCAVAPLFSRFPKAHGTPGAHAAISAILSGLYVKCAIFLFIRFADVFQEVHVPGFFLIIGIMTGIAGFMLALSQTDIMLILVYSTVSQVGLIMAGLSAPGAYSTMGAMYHIVNHALCKTALFLCAGVIADAYGVRDIRAVRGVWRQYPGVAIAMILAVLGITGAPFFNGSVSKYFILSGADLLVSGPLILINLGTITVFIRYSAMLFGRPEEGTTAVKIDRYKQTAVLILGALCLAGGVLGELSVRFLFNVDARVDPAGYLEKTAIFLLCGLAGYAIHKYCIHKSAFLKRIRSIDLGFRWICAAIGLFFAATLIVTSVVY